MVSKRDLGVSYFLGTGLGLVVSLLGYFLLVEGAAEVESIGTVTALGFAGSLPYLGYWLNRSDLSDSAVWAVARWCAVGVAVPTAFAGGLMVLGVRPRLVLLFPHLLVNLVAGGGVLGALLGVIRKLRSQYDRVDELNRRNRVLNHLMRHDIRNDVQVIDGYVDLIAARTEGVDEELLTPVRRKSEEIIETSRIARRIQTLEEGADEEPIDVVTLVREQVDSIRGTHPEAEIAADLPEAAWADAGEVFRSVIANLVENAIEHNDRPPEIEIDVETTGGDSVIVRIADNGPGIPEHVREAVADNPDPSTAESGGLGLWLAKWFVETYDGELAFGENDPRGTVVRIELPAVAREVPVRA